MNLFLVWLLQHYIIAIFPCGLKDNLAHGVVWTAILMKTRGGNQVVYFSTVILKEHQVGWSTFGLTTGHFWGLIHRFGETSSVWLETERNLRSRE